MAVPRFIADTHLGHRNIWKYRKVFESTLHNDLYFIRILQETSTKRDSMYFLGDIIFDEKYLDVIKELPGKKVLILGNHCSEYIHISKLASTFDDVHGLLKYKEFWLSHAPLHDGELRQKLNVHGHVHTESVPDTKYLNVSVDSTFMRYKPRTLTEVRDAFSTMQSTGEYFKGIEDEDALSVITSDPVTKEAYYWALNESRKIKVIL